MKIKYNTEIISGLVFVIVAAILWLLIPSQIQTLEKSAINAQTIPRIAIGGLFLCFIISTILLVISILLFYGARKWYYYAIPLVMVGVVYYVFGVLLRISLP